MLTAEQILALSPDDASAKAAKGLLSPGKWPRLGHDDAAIWGECQGSGSKPYQVVIDVSGPSFKCSCPSRKFPCKHGLALYLLLAQKADAFQGARPEWVEEWLSARQQRAEKQAEKKAAQAAAPVTPIDPGTAAKKRAQRLKRMMQGAQDLDVWLADLIQTGLADLPQRPHQFWRDAAARLVDAQAGGLAGAVRSIESIVSSGSDWQRRVLVQLGRLQLLSEALQRHDSLPEGLQWDVRASVGWPADKDDVLAAGERVTDVWRVLGISHDEAENLWERRVWLQGHQTGRRALLLEFSHGSRRYEVTYVAGTAVQATLGFFPSAASLRAIVLEAPELQSEGLADVVVANWDAALEPVASMLGMQPFLQRLPLHLSDATPVRRERNWWLRDADGREVSLRISDDDGWQLLALSGGRPLTMFGEWQGETCRPLTAWRGNGSEPCWTEAVISA